MKTIYFDNTKNAKDYAPKLDTIFRYVNSDGSPILLKCVQREEKHCKGCCLWQKHCGGLVCVARDRKDKSNVKFMEIKK